MVFQLDRAGGWLSGLCLCFPGRSFCASPAQPGTAVLAVPFLLVQDGMSFSLPPALGGTRLCKRGDSNTPEHLCFWHRTVLDSLLPTGSFVFINWLLRCKSALRAKYGSFPPPSLALKYARFCIDLLPAGNIWLLNSSVGGLVWSSSGQQKSLLSLGVSHFLHSLFHRFRTGWICCFPAGCAPGSSLRPFLL